jgi:hypothetical protein
MYLIRTQEANPIHNKAKDVVKQFHLVTRESYNMYTVLL